MVGGVSFDGDGEYRLGLACGGLTICGIMLCFCCLYCDAGSSLTGIWGLYHSLV